MYLKKVYLQVLIGLLLMTISGGHTFGQASAKQDTLFKEPYVDVDEWREVPVRHRYVHGGFKGTSTRFSFYFPPKEQYQGRFFQYITPVPDNEYLSQGANGEGDKIGFSTASGAYLLKPMAAGKRLCLVWVPTPQLEPTGQMRPLHNSRGLWRHSCMEEAGRMAMLSEEVAVLTAPSALLKIQKACGTGLFPL